MKKLEILITEEQYDRIQQIIRQSNTDHLSEGVFGGYELILSIGIPDVFPTSLNIKTNKTTEIGEVEWQFKADVK